MADLLDLEETDLSVGLAAGFSSFSEEALRGTGVEEPFVEGALGLVGVSVEGGVEGVSRASFNENMRVRRFLTEDFSGTFKNGSEVTPLAGPFCGVAAGEFLLPSCDLTDEGFEFDAEGGFGELEAVGIFVRVKVRPRPQVTEAEK